MVKLFLSGGGDAEQTRRFDTFFYSELRQKRILYIPLAMDEREHSYPSCLEWVTSAFRQIGMVEIKMMDKLLPGKADFSKYGAIYIGGGNTFKLLKLLKESGFLEQLRVYILKGGIVYGGSAGAIILGKDIGTSHDKNEVGLKELAGLNLVGGCSVWCHYKKEEDEKITAYAKRSKVPVIALPEESGVRFLDGTIRVEGKEKVAIFEGGRKSLLSPGEERKL